MALIFKCLTLPLLIYIGFSLGYRRRIFKDFRQKQYEYSILSNNGPSQGQDHNIICQAAKCEYKSTTTYTVTNPECGNYYTCQECPTSMGNDICYLGITSEEWVNVTEGHVEVTKHDKVYKNEEIKKMQPKEDYDSDYDPDEDSFIQEDSSKDPFDTGGLGTSFVHKFISSQTFGYVDHNDDKWVLENKEQCDVDADGNLDLSVRLIFQYYPTPFQMFSESLPQKPSKTYLRSDNIPSNIQLSQSCDGQCGKSSCGTTNNNHNNNNNNNNSNNNNNNHHHTTTDDDTGNSMLQMGIFEPDDSDDDSEGEEGNFFTTFAKKSIKFGAKSGSSVKNSLKKGIKFLVEKAQIAMTSPQLQIHFVLDDINIRNCRQPLSWTGDMPASAFIFVGNQNFKLHRNHLNAKFLRKSLKLNTTVKGIYELAFNSCVQVHCTKKRPYQSQYLVSPYLGRPSPNFNISRKLMGYFNRSVPENGHQHYLVTTTTPNLAAPAGAGAAQLGTQPAQGVTTTPLVQPTTAVVAPQLTAGGVTAPGAEQTATTTPVPTGPVTNIPSFNAPAATGTTTAAAATTPTTDTSTVQPAAPSTLAATLPTSAKEFFGDVVKPGPRRTRFLIFVGVGLVILTIIIYFFFVRR